MTENANPLASLKPRKTDMKLANSAGYIKPIKLCADLTGEVQEGKAKKGDFFFGKTRNLGREVEIVPVEGRPHALWLDGSTVKLESFEEDSDDFKEIVAARKKYVQGAAYGFDYLCYLPGENDYCVDFLCKTSLDTAPDFEKNIGVPVILTSYEKPQKKNPKVKYGIQQVQPCTNPTPRHPTADQHAAALELFRNPRLRSDGEQTPDAEAPAPKAGGRAARKAA